MQAITPWIDFCVLLLDGWIDLFFRAWIDVICQDCVVREVVVNGFHWRFRNGHWMNRHESATSVIWCQSMLLPVRVAGLLQCSEIQNPVDFLTGQTGPEERPTIMQLRIWAIWSGPLILGLYRYIHCPSILSLERVLFWAFYIIFGCGSKTWN